MSKLFLMAGTKGGIGKSLVASLLADMAFDRKYRPVLFDCDDENHTLYQAYQNDAPDVVAYDISMRSRGRKTFPLDKVVNLMVGVERDKKRYPGENAYIIDMKAGTSEKSMNWLGKFPFAELKAIDIDSQIVGIITEERDSCYTMLPWLRCFLTRNLSSLVHFSIIKNEIAGDDFEFFAEDIRKLIEVADVPCTICQLMDWGDVYQKEIQRHNTTYGKVATGRSKIDKFGFMDEYRIKSYYADTSKMLEPLWTKASAFVQQTEADGESDK